MRVKCLSLEHKARARTRTARPGDESSNHEATAPPWLFSEPPQKQKSWSSFALMRVVANRKPHVTHII